MSSQPPPPPPPPGAPGLPAAQGPAVTNGMAVASLITGIIGVVLFWTIVPPIVLGILAVVFGAVAKGRANGGAPNGSMAIVGLILGIVAIAASVAMILLWTNAFTTTEVKIGSDVVEIGSVLLRR